MYGIKRRKKSEMESNMARYAAMFHPGEAAFDVSTFVPTDYVDGPIPRRRVPVSKAQKEQSAGKFAARFLPTQRARAPAAMPQPAYMSTPPPQQQHHHQPQHHAHHQQPQHGHSPQPQPQPQQHPGYGAPPPHLGGHHAQPPPHHSQHAPQHHAPQHHAPQHHQQHHQPQQSQPYHGLGMGPFGEME